MEKIKSRWSKNYLEGTDATSNDNKGTDGYNINSKSINNHNNISNNENNNNNKKKHHHRHHHHKSKHSKPPTYEPLTENLYLDKRKKEHSRDREDARDMVCDCILTKEERADGVMGCLDDCLNRMLMIECGLKCTLGEHCLNKRFQKLQYANVEVFKTRKKGWGLRAATEIPAGSFIMEYVGEVVRSKEFKSRVKSYTKQKIKHHYFMALRSNEIIDATVKGNITRFINHSCEPNCETQKWTVNGDLRIGFFTIKDLQVGDEITFDYQFQRYGRKAQKCYCEAPSCRGYIGGSEQTLSLNGNSLSHSENKAQKKSFKHDLITDLSPGFKIPRLSKLQRIEMEKKLDKEPNSDEAIGNDKSIPEQRNPFASRNYFKPTTPATNNLVNNGTNKNSAVANKRRFDSLTTNNIDLTPAPKITKEEHRQQFEMHVRLKDYYEMINLLPMWPQLQASSRTIEPQSALLLLAAAAEQQQPLPTNGPLIVLANNIIEPAYAIDDELAFSICDYVEYYSAPDKMLSAEDVINDPNPYPGSYYTTPSGETYFATVVLDRRTKRPHSVILNLHIRSDADKSTSNKLHSYGYARRHSSPHSNHHGDRRVADRDVAHEKILAKMRDYRDETGRDSRQPEKRIRTIK